jgi:processive 1,2-diacylglycerol beta-glucosyltransferase
LRHKLSSVGRTTSGSARGRVVIISGSFGAGHDAAANAIAERLTCAGYTAEIWDIVKLMSRPLGRSLQAAYLKQVQLAPPVYRSLVRYANRSEGINKVIIKGMRHTGNALTGIAEHDPAAIVSTHPFASQALGDLRAQGDLRVPVVTYLTDLSVHRTWVHPAVDLHLALHELPARQAVAHGAQLTRLVRPAVPQRFFAKPSAYRSGVHCRQLLDLPLDQPLVALIGGSMGMGPLDRSAEEIAATGVATPVVVCGHNKRLFRRLRAKSSVIALDWVSDMPMLLTAVDGVVQNAGGFACLEALAAGKPTVTYRCISGHGETNAAALDRAGIVPWIRSRAELGPRLQQALATPPANLWPERDDGPVDVVDAILSQPMPQLVTPIQTLPSDADHQQRARRHRVA